MKNKLYTNQLVRPSIIETYLIDGIKAQHLNKKVIIVSDYDIPLCFPVHVYLNTNQAVKRAYLQIGTNYVHIPINPEFQRITTLCKRHNLNIEFNRNCHTKFKERHI